MANIIVHNMAKTQAKHAIMPAFKEKRLIFVDKYCKYTDKYGLTKNYSYAELARFYHNEIGKQWTAKTGADLELNTGLTVEDVEQVIKKIGGVK